MGKGWSGCVIVVNGFRGFSGVDVHVDAGDCFEGTVKGAVDIKQFEVLAACES